MGDTLDLSIILVNTNGKTLTEECIRTIESSGTRCTYEIVVSDNASVDGSREWLRQLELDNPHVKCVFNTDNPGFGISNNRALQRCQGRYILYLNNDTLVLEAFDALVAEADHLGPHCGALGGRVLNADRSIQLTCREQYTLSVLIWNLTLAFMGIRPRMIRRQELDEWDHASARDVAMVSGCYILVPRSVLDRLGAFDPNIFLYFEDTDLCYRIRDAGYVVRYVPVSTIIHLGGGSTRSKRLTPWALIQAAWSERYFARKYLGRGRARLLALATWMCWFAMWCVVAPLSAVVPLRAPRASLHHRAHLLWKGLIALPRQRFPKIA